MRTLTSILMALITVCAFAASGWFFWQAFTTSNQDEKAQATTQAQARPQEQPAPAAPLRTEGPDGTQEQSPTRATSSEAPAGKEDQEGSSEKEQLAQRFLDEGVIAFNDERYDVALRKFESALPYDRGALSGIGIAHYKLGDYRKSIEVLERSLNENGDEFKTLKFLSLAYYKSDEFAKSSARADRALAIQYDDELKQFRDKLQREQSALENRVDESNLHFKVIFDGYEHGSISYMILNTLDDAYRQIGREFGHFPDRTISVVLYTEKNYYDVTLAPAWSVGRFDGKIRMPIKGIENVDQKELSRVLHHEYVHAMIHDISPQTPRWVHEGLAEYLAPRNMERIGQVIPLQILDSAFSSEDTRIVRAAYQESYSVIAYLVERYNLYDVKQFLLALGRGQRFEQAFEDVFYISYAQFASEWGVE